MTSASHHGRWIIRPPSFTLRAWRLATSFLPGEAHALLFRAALADGEEAERGWRDWTARHPDPARAIAADARVRPLAPLVAANLRRHRVAMPRGFAVFAHARLAQAEARRAALMETCAVVIDRLNADGVPHVVLKGVAFVERVYPQPALRHIEDLDLLVPEGRLADATASLVRAGFRATEGENGFHHLPVLVGATGSGVDLHRRPRNQYPRFDADGIIARSEPAEIAGRPTRVPSPADILLHQCMHAVACGSFLWVADIWFIARALDAESWTKVAELADRCGLDIPLALTLGSIADDVGAVAPADVLSRLWAAVDRADDVARDAATFAARLAMPVGARDILRWRARWLDRLGHAWWRLAPPPRHLRWIYGIERRWATPFYYPLRLTWLADRFSRAASYAEKR